MNVLTEIKPYVLRDAYSYLEIINVDTLETRTVAEFDYLIEAPNWLRDGRILYNAHGTMYIMRPETGETRHIDTAHLSRCNNDHVLSPDEKLLGVTHRTVEDGLARIYVLPIAGGTPILITPIAPSFLHGWSPDGKTLIYCAERNGNFDIYAINAAGGEEKRLTTAERHDDGCEYTPDGRHIWFNSARDGNMQLFRMNADGSEQTRMSFSERNDWFPHISPDNRRVAYLSYGTDIDQQKHPADKYVQLRIMDTDGKNDRKLRDLFGGQGTINVNSWSQNNAELAYVRYKEK